MAVHTLRLHGAKHMYETNKIQMVSTSSIDGPNLHEAFLSDPEAAKPWCA